MFLEKLNLFCYLPPFFKLYFLYQGLFSKLRAAFKRSKKGTFFTTNKLKRAPLIRISPAYMNPEEHFFKNFMKFFGFCRNFTQMSWISERGLENFAEAILTADTLQPLICSPYTFHKSIRNQDNPSFTLTESTKLKQLPILKMKHMPNNYLPTYLMMHSTEFVIVGFLLKSQNFSIQHYSYVSDMLVLTNAIKYPYHYLNLLT